MNVISENVVFHAFNSCLKSLQNKICEYLFAQKFASGENTLNLPITQFQFFLEVCNWTKSAEIWL